MPSLTETSAAKSQLAAGLAEGVNTLSQDQKILFTKYVRLVLPLDGYVFWVKADLLSDSSQLGGAAIGKVQFGAPREVLEAAKTVEVQGSLHYDSYTDQREDETLGVNRVIFTALSEIQEFNIIGPTVMYIGEFQGIRFSFNRRQEFYQQADLYHYVGDAIYPAMESQIIDSMNGFDSKNVIVSDSLPIWLSLNQICPVYPSFLIPDNLRPPYAAIHIFPDQTRAIQSVPMYDRDGSHYQLVADRVRVTLYGMRNFNALDYQDYILDYMSNDENALGLMNMPVMRDEKRTQSELTVIAMKKTIEFEVSYYQSRVRDVARQFILSAIPNFYFQD
ncbi:hypothetical protein [Herbaspirillum huttiense]|uniref:hypothetical protein n=1 Tax=Herbaspirillum huttiense TaxID=863372 RepID=UPI0031D35B52